MADVAERNGETRCIRCNAPFPKVPVRMPFHRKGPPSTPRGRGAASTDAGGEGGNGKGKGGPQTPGLQGEPAAKAKAKAKPQRAPWWKDDGSGSGETTSATEVVPLNPKKFDDPIYLAKKDFEYSRRARREAEAQAAQQRLDALYKAKEEALPPARRVESPKRKAQAAEKALHKQGALCVDLEAQLDVLNQ